VWRVWETGKEGAVFLWVSKKERNRSEDLSGNGKITLNWISKKKDGWVGGWAGRKLNLCGSG
jgi:hypothetical protein